MSETKPDFTIEDVWINLNTVSSISTGTAYSISNKRSGWVLLHESATEPLSTDSSGRYLKGSVDSTDTTAYVKEGSLDIWAKSSMVGVVCLVNIQED